MHKFRTARLEFAPPDKHVVTLKGTVTNAAGRRKATSIAKRTEGVHRVVNRLTIGPKKDWAAVSESFIKPVHRAAIVVDSDPARLLDTLPSSR